MCMSTMVYHLCTPYCSCSSSVSSSLNIWLHSLWEFYPFLCYLHGLPFHPSFLLQALWLLDIFLYVANKFFEALNFQMLARVLFYSSWTLKFAAINTDRIVNVLNSMSSFLYFVLYNSFCILILYAPTGLKIVVLVLIEM